MQLTARHHEYWKKNLNITAILMVIWFVATFVMGYYARDLSFDFFGWPFSFYMAAQGSKPCARACSRRRVAISSASNSIVSMHVSQIRN